MMRFLRTATACAVIAIPAILQSQKNTGGDLALGQRVSARYDSAFTALVDSARRDSSAFAWLLELARFKSERIGWAYERNGSLRAITTVRRDAYLVVVPADDPAYAQMGSVMETSDGASVRATRIKADTIAGAWAAIFLAYELSHIRDDLLQLLPENAKPAQFAASSRRAYGAEYLAARVMGGRALEQHLDSVLTAVAPESAKALAENIVPVLRESFDRFDALLTGQSALTEREDERRSGVYAVALLLRYADKRAVSDVDFAAALRCMGGCR